MLQTKLIDTDSITTPYTKVNKLTIDVAKIIKTDGINAIPLLVKQTNTDQYALANTEHQQLLNAIRISGIDVCRVYVDAHLEAQYKLTAKLLTQG